MNASQDTGVVARAVDAIDSVVQIGTASSRVVAVSFPASVPADATTDHPLLDRVTAYCEGDPDAFNDVSVAMTVPTDQRAVLETLRDVPYGESITIDQLARATPSLDTDDTDNVRAAVSTNPAPIFVPDHRVRGAVGATPTRIATTLRAVEDIE